MTADVKEAGSSWGFWGKRKRVFAAAGGVGAAAIVGGLVALWPGQGGGSPVPGSSPSVTAAPSPTASSTPASEVVVLPDVLAASEIPWDEVGEGWFILGYGPVKEGSTDPWEEWFLGSGEAWVLSPTGEVFQGPQPPANSWGFAFWPGSEVWFGLPFDTDPAEGSCEPFSCGDVLAIDMQTGATRHPLASHYYPEGLERTVDGSIVRWLSCCDFGEATFIGVDGADTSFSVTSTLQGPFLTPDGTALVWFDYQYETPLVLVRASFNGEEDRYPLPSEEAYFAGWIDESTFLVSSFNFDDNYEVVDEQLLSIDLESGLVSEWIPPFDEFDHFEALTTGMWMWWFLNSPDPVVTNNDGTIRIPLECAGTHCVPHVSGDRLLWVEEWETPTDDSKAPEGSGRQRLTLVDLTTGDQTVIFNALGATGRVVDVMPHARVYE